MSDSVYISVHQISPTGIVLFTPPTSVPPFGPPGVSHRSGAETNFRAGGSLRLRVRVGFTQGSEFTLVHPKPPWIRRNR